MRRSFFYFEYVGRLQGTNEADGITQELQILFGNPPQLFLLTIHHSPNHGGKWGGEHQAKAAYHCVEDFGGDVV